MAEHPTMSQMPPGEPIPGKTYRADGWAYVDPPTKFSPEMWEYFLSVIGEGNYVVLAYSSGEDWSRGQLLVSPAGWRNMTASIRRRS